MATIQDFIGKSSVNTLQDQADEKAFEDPLVGFSSGNDRLYEAYKEYVGPFHWTPWEIFTQTFPQTSISPTELTVISWVLPQTELPTKNDVQAQIIPLPPTSEPHTI